MLKIKEKFKNPIMKSDPAPSRLAYLFRRFLLKKSFRLSLITIIPALFICLPLASVNNKHNLNILIKNNVEKLSKFIAFSPAFKVVNLSVISNEPIVIEKIKTSLALKFPLSSLDIDVVALKEKVENINLVHSSTVRLTSNGLIEISVKIRKPVVVQRIDKKFLLLDITGVKVDEVFSRAQRADLPLLVGIGSDRKVREALNLLIETKSLIARVRGLVRIGERRWDVILDKNQSIKLPEENPIEAMKKVVSLHEGRGLLNRDILYLDFRNVNRPVLGLSNDATRELRTIRNVVRGENV